MKQFPLSPYHQFSNSSLNSDFYDRYLSHDGHQPLQTPLIGIERTQDLLSLKLPPHGPDEQDSQRFPKEWSFNAEDTKHDDSDARSDDTPPSASSSRLKPAPKDKDEGRRGSKVDPVVVAGSSSLLSMKQAFLNHHHQQQQQQQVREAAAPVEITRGFFFRYNERQATSSAGSSKSSRQSSNSDEGATDRRAQQQQQANGSSSDNNNYDHEDNDDDDNSKGQDIFVESMKHFNPLKRNQQSSVANVVAGDQSDDGVCYDLRSKNCSPDEQQQQQQQQQQPPQQQQRQRHSGTESDHSEADNAISQLSQQYHGQESCFGLDPSKQRFQYVLAAPISVATKLNEDTMTYLNQGQAYEIKLGNLTDVAEARKGFMCSIINIGFHERHMQQAENELWQQWSQQHPNEKIFSVDMKLSYNVYGVDSDGLNKYEFLWDSSKAAGVFIRINSISTEFTPKKHGGEKGVPFRLSIETFSYNSKTHDSYFISAASCQIKVFKPKGAERKIRSDRDKIYKRPLSEQDKYHRSCDHTTFHECSLSSLHPMADNSLCYYRHSHGHFASKQVSTSGGSSGGAGGSGSSSNSNNNSNSSSSNQTHGHQTGEHNSDEELDQHAPPGGLPTNSQHTNSDQQADMDQNNRSSATTELGDANSPNSDHHQQQQQHLNLHQANRTVDNGGPDQHQHHSKVVGLQSGESPYSSSHHRLSAMHSYRHDHLNTLDNDGHHNQSNNDSFGAINNDNDNNNNNNEHHQPYPTSGNNQTTVRTGLSANPHSFHGMTAHYYGHPLSGALVPSHHHHHHHHLTPAPSYGVSASSALTGPMSHSASSAGFSLPNHHVPALQDVKTSIYHRHHQLVSDKQPFSQHAAAAVAMTASYGAAAAFKSHHHSSAAAAAAAAAAANLGQLGGNYQSYFVASSSSASSATAAAAVVGANCTTTDGSLSHDQTSANKELQQHQQNNNNSLANNGNCYNDSYNQPQLHSLRQRSASTSLATTHCQNPYARNHLDPYHFNSSATATVGSNENLSPQSQNNNNNHNNIIPHNQWNPHQQNNNGAAHHQGGYTADCGNIQGSESPSSCCSRYNKAQPYMMSQLSATNESGGGADVKYSPSSGSAHITINSTCMEVVSWFASNRFGVLAKTFNNFSGADLLRLSKTELIEICGLIEGIRLFNSLHNQPIKPRRVLYICLETDDIYHPIYLYDLTLDELLSEISLILETNSIDDDDDDDDDDGDGANQDNNEDNDDGCISSHPQRQTQTGKLTTTGSTSGSSSGSRASSRPVSSADEMNDDEAYRNSEQYFEEMHGGGGSCSDQDKNQTMALNNGSKLPPETSNHSLEQQSRPLSHQISRLLVDGVASVKVAATEKVVQMLEDESVWTLNFQTKLSGSIEACITASRAHKRLRK